MEGRCWLLLEKSNATRVSQGIDQYEDMTGTEYHYDSFVPNHKNVSAGDQVVLRYENTILGAGVISDIRESQGVKIHRRCPHCNATDSRKRRTRTPAWKCGKCSREFESPVETQKPVTNYKARISQFVKFELPPPVVNVKECSLSDDGRASQLSIIELDRSRLAQLVEGRESLLGVAPGEKTGGGAGQGIGLSYDERRAVELRGMAVARQVYERAGWKVVDTSSSRPYDLLAEKGYELRYVEVKGTTGQGLSVILTSGEVAHVREHAGECALVVVSNIRLDKEDGAWRGSGGAISTHRDPWNIEDRDLSAKQFVYGIRDGA